MNRRWNERHVEKTIAVVALCIAIGGLAVVGSVVAANGFAIPRSVIGGGGQEASGGGMVLNGTIAEPIASDLQVGPAYGLSSGFWQPAQARTIYLPLLLRQAAPQ